MSKKQITISNGGVSVNLESVAGYHCTHGNNLYGILYSLKSGGELEITFELIAQRLAAWKTTQSYFNIIEFFSERCEVCKHGPDNRWDEDMENRACGHECDDHEDFEVNKEIADDGYRNRTNTTGTD